MTEKLKILVLEIILKMTVLERMLKMCMNQMYLVNLMHGDQEEVARVHMFLFMKNREFNDIRLKIESHIVEEHGKNPEEIKKEIEDEKNRYYKSIYASHNYDPPKLVGSNNEENKEKETEPKENNIIESLENGNISISRNYFPYLVIPHNISVFLSQEQRNDLKYIPVHYDKESKECILKIKFKDVQKFIPYKIFKKIWDDNNVYSSEMQINNSNFFQFFKNTLQEEKLINQQDNQEKLSLLYDLSVKMIFDMLVYSFHNESIILVTEVFTQLLLLSKEVIYKFADYILQDNGSEFIRILMKCGETVVRESVSTILSTAINKMFDNVELIEKAEKFMNFMINAINSQASPNWTKFEQFFNMINKVAIGGEPQLRFMKELHMETLLADFFLAERSPIRPSDENRM